MNNDKIIKETKRINKILENDEKKFYRENSNIPKEYWDYKWKNTGAGVKFYDPSFSSPGLRVSKETERTRENARNIALNYVSNLKKNVETGKSLLFVGGKNSGKTVLATLILREAINGLVGDVLFVPFSQLVVESNVYLPQDVGDFTEKYIEPTILCIDDIDGDREGASKFRDYLDHILTSRRLAQSPTIVTSKIDLTGILRVCGKSVFSLLGDSSIYKKVNIVSNDSQDLEVDYLCTGLSFSISDLERELKKYRSNNPNNDVVDSSVVSDLLRKSIKA